jgi:hypothetical protein
VTEERESFASHIERPPSHRYRLGVVLKKAICGRHKAECNVLFKLRVGQSVGGLTPIEIRGRLSS